MTAGESAALNTAYLERATQGLREAGKLPDDGMRQYLSPLGWEHINLTGECVWRQRRNVEEGNFHPLRGDSIGIVRRLAPETNRLLDPRSLLNN
ncbi:MAG: Tn3 family transposase [Burkholderiaceae bacterium]|nr:Tn3 family transposase [Burkholderiaceae bacterium]